jgi:hypothetical protein
MKYTYCVLIALSACLAHQETVAQDRAFGLGVMIGEPTGVSAKLWTSAANAFDFGLGWSIRTGSPGTGGTTMEGLVCTSTWTTCGTHLTPSTRLNDFRYTTALAGALTAVPVMMVRSQYVVCSASHGCHVERQWMFSLKLSLLSNSPPQQVLPSTRESGHDTFFDGPTLFFPRQE